MAPSLARIERRGTFSESVQGGLQLRGGVLITSGLRRLEPTPEPVAGALTGIEFELSSSPWDGGFISLNIGPLDANYTDFSVQDPDDPTGPPIDRSDENLGNRTPEYTITASIEHAFLLGNGATVTPQIGMYAQPDFEWRGGTNKSDPDHPLCHQEVREPSNL